MFFKRKQSETDKLKESMVEKLKMYKPESHTNIQVDAEYHSDDVEHSQDSVELDLNNVCVWDMIRGRDIK